MVRVSVSLGIGLGTGVVKFSGSAESKMRNRKCGITLIVRSVKPRDRFHFTDCHTELLTRCD